MIGHHAQAVEMVALIEARTTRADMRTLGHRIEVSQSDEIRMMQRWLEVRHQPLPGPHAHHGAGAVLMPGMLTPEEMARLAEAHGPAFDRLFLEGMIKHHAGALTMVKDLFATPGAARTRRSLPSRPMWTPISGWRSTGCARCSAPMRRRHRQFPNQRGSG